MLNSKWITNLFKVVHYVFRERDRKLLKFAAQLNVGFRGGEIAQLRGLGCVNCRCLVLVARKEHVYRRITAFAPMSIDLEGRQLVVMTAGVMHHKPIFEFLP